MENRADDCFFRQDIRRHTGMTSLMFLDMMHKMNTMRWITGMSTPMFLDMMNMMFEMP